MVSLFFYLICSIYSYLQILDLYIWFWVIFYLLEDDLFYVNEHYVLGDILHLFKYSCNRSTGYRFQFFNDFPTKGHLYQAYWFHFFSILEKAVLHIVHICETMYFHIRVFLLISLVKITSSDLIYIYFYTYYFSPFRIW